MHYSHLGNTGLKVSKICLGTMTWGQQNTEQEAFQQLDYAKSKGINFIDTAELYPVPPNSSTYTQTEKIIGRWFKQRGCRHEIILATKIAGPGLDYIRGGSRFTGKQLHQAVDQSLDRLQTDYIDLYQLHWPERQTNFFGKLGYVHAPEEASTPLIETLEACNQLVQSGKVRHLGISNETPWGVMSYLKIAQEKNWPRMVSIQNPYNLLNRTFEIGLAEIAHRENCGLLAYSPLAFGVLSGKYLKDQLPKGSRLQLFPQYNRYQNPISDKLTEQYVSLAKQNELSPAQLALAFVNSRGFLTSTIIGATQLEQLQENISSIEVTLSDSLLQSIESIHLSHPNPCP